jgi:predicted Ser/Thr protein kinase
MDLVKRLEEYRDRERELMWEGTFAQYFEIATKKPQVSRLSHERIYHMINDAGVETTRSGEPHYKFFDQEIFGIEKPLQQIVDYFHSAAQRLEVRKRVLLLMGPVGGGKSTIVYLLKRGLEAYTRTPDGAVYAIKDCPMHEEPLHLIPNDLREDVEKEFGLYIEGDLCPHCRYMVDTHYQGHIEDVPVKRITFSEKYRTGIGTFTPSDPKSQDISELVGGIDLSTIGEVGVESDPRAYRFDGELNIANRGVMEFVEMLKCLLGDSLVFTHQGIRRLDSFAQLDHPEGESREVELQIASQTGLESATHLYHAGVKPTKRITTRRGYASEGGFEHRVLVVNEDGVQVWKRHDELQIGDWVALQKGQNLWGQDVTIDWQGNRPRHALPIRVPERMTPDLARWLGYLLAEGDARPDGTIRFANIEDELRSDYARLTETLFGISPRHYKGVIQLNSVELLDLLNYLGFKTGAYNKEIPWSVLQSSRDCTLEFLAGYFAGDGTVNLGGRLSWVTASEELAKQLQIVLLNLGVVSRRVQTHQRSAKDAPYGDYWSVTASGEDADRLASQMRLLPVRKQFTYDQRRSQQRRAGRADVIPHTSGYWTAISDELQNVIMTKAMAANGSGYRVREGAHQILGEDYINLHMLRTATNTCTREMATKILGKLDGWIEPPTGLSSLLNPSQFYDEIVSIEDGEADCWDLHVPGSNTFIANGIVNHNCDEKFLYVLLTLSQEQNIKTGRFSMIYADEVVVSHTNEHEYQSFVGNKKSEALQDRIILAKVPYNLRVSDEVKIYEKLLKQSSLQNVHIAPYTLRVASIFALLTRLEPSKKAGMSLMKKLKLYDGEDIEDFKQKDIKELQDEAVREGMDGISPRYVINRLSNALIKQNVTCINPIDALRALRDGLDQHTSITREERERYLNFVAEARKEYDQIAMKEVQRAFVYSYEESARTLLNNYLDNVESYCNKTKLRDPITDEEMEPDEQLMRSIEEQIGVTENAKRSFREEILIRISSLARKGLTFDYNSHERLKEAIEKKLFADLRDVVKITTSTRTPDKEQLRKINEVVDRLMSEHGYCHVCANEILRYTGSLLNR